MLEERVMNRTVICDPKVLLVSVLFWNLFCFVFSPSWHNAQILQVKEKCFELCT